MKPKTKAPRVRWAKVVEMRNHFFVKLGSKYFGSYIIRDDATARAFVLNAELSRLVAARERRKARTSSAFDRDLTSILDSAPTRKLVKAEAKRRAKK